MDAKKLQLGAWAAIVATALSLLIAPLSFLVTSESELTLRLFFLTVMAALTWLTVVWILVLRDYFRFRNIPKVDRWLNGMIMIELISLILFAASIMNQVIEVVMSIAGLGLVIAIGVLLIGFGVALTRWDGDLFSLGRPIAILSIVTGALMVTVIGAIPAILTSVAWAVLVLIVMFKGAAELKSEASQ